MKEILKESEPKINSNYLEARLQNQIEWYSEKSSQAKWWFYRLRIVEMVFAMAIPFMTAYITNTSSILKIVVGFMGVSVAFIAGIITLYKFHENWINYRNTSETLKHEKWLFLTKSGPYRTPEAYEILVERVESLISTENTNWTSYVSRKEDQQK